MCFAKRVQQKKNTSERFKFIPNKFIILNRFFSLFLFVRTRNGCNCIKWLYASWHVIFCIYSARSPKKKSIHIHSKSTAQLSTPRPSIRRLCFFLSLTKYRWNRNKCTNLPAVFTGERRKTIKIKSRMKKKTFAYFFLCVQVSFFAFDRFFELSFFLRIMIFQRFASEFFSFMSVFIVLRTVSSSFACVINTLWLATNISSVRVFLPPKKTKIEFVSCYYFVCLNLIDGCFGTN